MWQARKLTPKLQAENPQVDHNPDSLPRGFRAQDRVQGLGQGSGFRVWTGES